jgi:carbonic anhydrase
MTVTDELLRNDEQYAASFGNGALPLPPAKQIAIVACMDARLNPYGLLGLEEGDAHVIRNAGRVITQDELRSLAVSRRLLGALEIALIHHTDCGMLTFTDDEFREQILADTGIKPRWAGRGVQRSRHGRSPEHRAHRRGPVDPRQELRPRLRPRPDERDATRGEVGRGAAGPAREYHPPESTLRRGPCDVVHTSQTEKSGTRCEWSVRHSPSTTRCVEAATGRALYRTSDGSAARARSRGGRRWPARRRGPAGARRGGGSPLRTRADTARTKECHARL